MKNILFLNTVQNKAWKNRTLFLMLALVISIGNAWGHGGKHYGKAVLQNATGHGTVYLSTASGSNTGQTDSINPGTVGGQSWITWDCGEDDNGKTKTYYPRYKEVEVGYYYAGWAKTASATTYESATKGMNFSTEKNSNYCSAEKAKTTTIYGFFKPVTVTAAPEDVYIEATNPSATYNDLAGTVVSFTTANSNKIGDFTTSESGDARWVISAWTRASASSTTFNYKFVGDGSYGTNNRTLTKTVTLTSKGDLSNPKTCTLTAKYPNPKVITCDEVATDLAIYPIFKATDDEAANIKETTAVFDVVYADDVNNFTATFSNATGGGEWIVTGISVDQAKQKVTVSYTFRGKKIIGTHTALLTLTANNCNGWNDAEAAGGQSVTITLTAHNEQEAVNEVSVTTAGGVTTEYATWAEGLAVANANAGCTLTLLRNIDLGTITTTNSITKAMTIDLNGKELRAAVNAASVGILTITQAVAVTIKDSKTGGKIINEIARNSEIRTIFVNKAGATLTLESGTIAVNNLGQYASDAATVDGVAVAKYASCSAHVIHQAAGTTVNINGGRVEAHGTRSVYGIRQESSAATNKARTTVLNITGGEIYAEAPYGAYGLQGYGKVNFSGGNINVKANTNMVDARYAADNANNKYNGLIYGILISASANATATNCYYGTLNMTGGNINVTNERVYAVDRKSYGICFQSSNATQADAAKTPDGTHSQKVTAIGQISGGKIIVNTGTYYGFGVYATSDYNSYDNTHRTIQIKNCEIDVTAHTYATGVMAYVGVSTSNGACYGADIELTNCTINATTTVGAYAEAAFVSSNYGTIYENVTPAYAGEYAAAAKLTINSGTYTSNTATSNSYCIKSGSQISDLETWSKTMYAPTTNANQLQELGGNAEAYPELIIHGGTFTANTASGKNAARAVSSGGHTVIDGGTFIANSGGNNGYGLVAISGTMKVSGATVRAEANASAYGVLVSAGISNYTMFDYAADVELNNCDVTATTRTGTEARGVSVTATTKTQTEATREALSAANKNKYYNLYQVCEKSAAGKVKINGGTYRATAATTTAYGVLLTTTSVSTTGAASASPEATIKNATFISKTQSYNGSTATTTAYGIYAGGPTIIDGCNITVQPQTSTAYGVYASDQKTTVTNTKIDVKGTATTHGFYANAQINGIGRDLHGELELGEGNDVTVAATSGNTSHVMTLIAAKKNIASGNFAGDYATAASALVTDGSYKATATGKTSYVLNLSAEQVQGDVKAAPSCIIEGGKFWAMADGGTTGICSTNGVIGNILFKGGVYNVNTTLSKHIPEGYEEFPLPDDRPEYTEGYRYAIEPVGNHGNYVCQIGSTKYKSLEEALQVVTSGQVIYMLANYVMTTPGDYMLPSGATLLIPYKDGTGIGASEAIGDKAQTTESGTTPTLFRKLTLGEGVNLTCFGTIETSAQQRVNGQYGANVGMASGAYGQIHMEEGSHISLESGSRLNCWGYVTGKGTINVKKGATSLEGFQLGDWCGGGNFTGGLGGNNEDVFPVTHYYYQSIECPITYRPGSSALGSTHILVSIPFLGDQISGQDGVPMVGTSGSMFIMDENDESAETWLMKDYDETTDQCVWTINSGATLGNLTVEISGYEMASKDYDLPVTPNMSVVLNSGEIELTQNTVFLPGSQMIINKQGTAVLDGIKVTMYDADDWVQTTRYFASYSPTWGTNNPRKNLPIKDAEFFMHGKLDIRNNGGLYTTLGGANIHSTNADAGEVIYTTAAQGNTTNYYLQLGTTNRVLVETCPALLKNGDGITPAYSASSGTVAGKTWTYKNDIWDCWSKDGCFFMNAQDKPHAKPAELVELTSKTPDANHLHHDAATGLRNFVWDENCYWWEVVTTPTAEGYYKSLNADNNGNYNYYYYDSAADCWKIKKITVTWNVNGTTTPYSVGYGVKPEWFGATPTKTSSSDNYVWRWDGWTMGSDPTVLANNNLPFVTEDITFTAHFSEKYYEYNITFKNDDGTILESKNWIAGTTPSYEGTPTKNPTAAETFEFNGTWTPAITPVSGPVAYVANYTSHTRKYTITFLNYDMSVLGTAEVPYGSTPTRATYLEAVAPLKDDPYKPDNSAYLFEFAGWRLYGASSNGFVEVAGDQMYIAQYNQTKKYLIQILDIVDADNANKTLTINATSFALSGWPYTINDVEYVRPTDRMLTIPYGDKDPNAEIVIEVKDKEGTVVSYNMYIVPFVYTGEATMSGTDENSIVFVKSGTLTVGDASAKEIYVAPGAALQVNENGTLDVKKLVLRTTPFEAAILTNKGTIVGQVYYSRIARDTDFHLFAIPAGSNTAGVVLSDGTSAAVASTVAPYGNAWQLREYNTARRAEAGDDGANWNNIGWDNIVVNGDTRDTTYSDVAIEASKGYELRSGSKYYREYLFPVTLPTTAATSVQVTDSIGAKGAAHAGWNILCSPYTDVYKVEYDPSDPTKGITVSWQQPDGSYTQVKPTVIPPAIPFAYQASKGEEKLYFAGSTIAAAPRKQSAAEALTETEWVHLDIFDTYGEGDETSLFVHPTRFEQTYKTGIDVAKQSLTAARPIIYSTHAYGDMAFAGVADSLLENGIDLVVYSPSAQELTFSLRENKFLNRLEYLWLADNETGERTDLLMDDYTCRANAGTIKGRFVLNGRFKAPQISTGLGNTQTDYNIYAIGNNIAISGVEQGTPIYVFDAVGHMIYTTAATSDEVIVPAPCAGVYMLTIGGQTAKLVVNK